MATRCFWFLLIGIWIAPAYLQGQAERDYMLNGKDDLAVQNYHSALYYFNEALKIQPQQAEARFFKALCLLQLHKPQEALPLFEKLAPSESPQGAIGLYTWIAECHFLLENFEEAALWVQKARKADTKNRDFQTLLDNLERFIPLAQEAYQNKESYWVENLGTTINSPYDDFGIILDKRQKELIFTSNRFSINKRQAARLYDNDRFTTHYSEQNYDGTWAQIQDFYVLDEESAEAYQEVVVLQILERSFSGSDKKLLISKNGELHIVEQKQGEWLPSQLFSKSLNSDKGIQRYAYLTKDKKTIVFASDYRSKGNYELFVAHFDPKTNDWLKPQALEQLNSPYDEVAPFIADDKTLYFSSKGHNSIGGYDVFKAAYNAKTQQWESPQRLGYPINTVADDFYFQVYGQTAYLVSNRKGSMGGEDIFRIFLFDSLQVRGKVLNAENQQPIAQAQVRFIAKQENLQWDLNTNEKGEYAIKIPISQEIDISVSYEGKSLYQQVFPIKPASIANKPQKDIVQNFYIKIPEQIKQEDFILRAGKRRYVLKNVFFATGSNRIDPASHPELYTLAEFLTQNPTLKIEVGGHTDNVGRADENMLLSQMRADAVKRFLTTKGKISESRISTRGYGDTQPLASNDDELEGRELNRRIEITITE
jgi:outer membrane protein OmpA-like peptidoglycan-associated protein